MRIKTVFAHISCTNLERSAAWYEKLFGQPPTRPVTRALAEWQFTDSAEIQLHERPEHAGHSGLTLGVLPLEPERVRLEKAGLHPEPIQAVDDYFVMRIHDPDSNPVVFASARRT